MLLQAKRVEADCITDINDGFNSGLTKGMLHRNKNHKLMLGIYETDDNKVLTVSSKEQNPSMQGVITAIEQISASQKQTQHEEPKQFPYSDRGQSYPDKNSRQQAKKERRVERVNWRMQKHNQYYHKEDSNQKWRQYHQPQVMADNQLTKQLCSFHNSTTHSNEECRSQQRNKSRRVNDILVTEALQETDNMDNEEGACTPLLLIGLSNARGEDISVIGDSGASVCPVAKSEVRKNNLKLIKRGKNSITRGMGKLNLVKSRGIVRYPMYYEGHKITVLGRVFKDEDMPESKQLLIGNNHQLQRHTLIDYDELLYYTTADDGTRLAIPFSAGELQFTHKKFLLCTTRGIELPPESMQDIQVQLRVEGDPENSPFVFQHPTLLLEKQDQAGIILARGILQTQQKELPTVRICNISQAHMTVEKGEIIGIASLCSSEVLNIAPLRENETNLTSDSEFIGWESTNDSLPDLIPDSDSLPPLLSDFVEDSSDTSQDFEPSPPYDPLRQFHTLNGMYQSLNHSFVHNNFISGSEAQTLNLSSTELLSKQKKRLRTHFMKSLPSITKLTRATQV